MRALERVVISAGVGFLLLFVGFLAGMAGLPPATLLRQAKEAAEDLWANRYHYLGIRSKYLHPVERREGGVTIWDRQRAFDGYTFVAAWREGRYRALLLAMDGTVVHEWTVPSAELWPDQQSIFSLLVPFEEEVNFHGAWLTPQGELLLDVYGLGTVKLDRCSRVEWVLRRNTHHDIDLLDNGELWFPAFREVTESRPDRPHLGPGPLGYYLEETLLRVSPSGEILEEISLIDVIYASGRADLLISGPGASVRSRVSDPLHNNNVEILRPELAPAFPMFEAGDILVSFRNIDTIAVLDGRTRRIKWTMRGPFIGQHDPDFLPDGHILLYDNRMSGRRPAFGNSRILEIDPATRSVVWSWEGEGRFAFYAPSRGEQQQLPNGNILVAYSHGGRVFEIEPRSGDVVWEWVNLHEPGWAGDLRDAIRFAPDALPFLAKPCPGSDEASAAARE